MENIVRLIPNRIKKHRKIMGYKQKDVALLLGFDSTTQISRWEKGTALPNVINLIKLSVIFRTIPTELYFELLQRLRKELFKKEKKYFRSDSDDDNIKYTF